MGYESPKVTHAVV
ncbi:hypothetical protein CEXT_245911, partial [Caerostris extrusa]